MLKLAKNTICSYTCRGLFKIKKHLQFKYNKPRLRQGGHIMLMGNDCHDCRKYNRMEMKNVNKDIVAWLEDIVEENNSRIERKEWKSKYNSYVVYDYEPFCTDGFEINLVITSYDAAYLNFIKYLYDEKISTIEYLNSCIGA